MDAPLGDQNPSDDPQEQQDSLPATAAALSEPANDPNNGTKIAINPSKRSMGFFACVFAASNDASRIYADSALIDGLS